MFFENNRDKVTNVLNNKEALVLFSGKQKKTTADGLYPFKVNKNFFYMTGLKRENFILVLMKINDVVSTKLFIESPNEKAEKWYGRKLKKEAVTELSGIADVDYVETFNTWFNGQLYENTITSVYLDLEKMSWDEIDESAHLFSKQLKERYAFIDIKTAHPYLSELRTIKADYEIDELRKAVALTDKSLKKVMDALKPGSHEYQMASTFLHEVIMNGGDGLSFPTIAASGEDAVVLHYEENEKEILDNTLMLFDCGAQWNEYCADITRTYPSNGKFSDRQKVIYNIVLEAEETCIAAAKPGMTIESMNEICKEVLAKGCIEIGLIKEASELSKYYYHGVSHFLGLDTHDLGDRKIEFKPGMVITVEPGLYIEEEGIGVRIEDDILITETGQENLSEAIIKSVDEIEAYMAKRV